MKVAPQAVCLLIDCSGSMSIDHKLDEVKAVAVQFARRQDLTRDSLAVVGFGSRARIWTGRSRDLVEIEAAIDELREGGTTAMARALTAAREQLDGSTAERTILLFTDGVPDLRNPTLEAAATCRNAGVRIVAVATGDADKGFLARVTDDNNLVFLTESGSFGEAFERAEKVIYPPPTLLESSAFQADTSAEQLPAILRIGAWTALLSLGIAFALIVVQNRHLHRRALSLAQATLALPGSLVAGFAAGAAGQFLYLQAAPYPSLEVVARFAAWTLLGALLGRGMAYVVPNLGKRRAWIAGAIGGALGAGGFIEISHLLRDVAEWGDIAARLAGAAVLGLSIGLMIALVDTVFRDVWLEVDYGNNETEQVTLGTTPVSVGSDDSQCTIYAGGVEPVACRFRIADDAILCEDVAAHSTGPVEPGTALTIGKVSVMVCARGKS